MDSGRRRSSSSNSGRSLVEKQPGSTATIRDITEQVEPEITLDVVPDDEDDNRIIECAVAGEADHRHLGAADLGADDRREAVAAGAEESRRQVLAPVIE